MGVVQTVIYLARLTPGPRRFLLVLAGLFFFFVMASTANMGLKRLARASSLSTESVVGEWVIVHGRIAPDEEIHRHGLAYGVLQEYNWNMVFWKTEERFGGYIRLLSDTGLEVKLLPSDAPDGDVREFKISRETRVIGHAPGDELFLVGRLSSVRPYELEAFGETFGGDRAAFTLDHSYWLWGYRLVGIGFFLLALVAGWKPSGEVPEVVQAD